MAEKEEPREIGYIAGLFDVEGYISLTRSNGYPNLTIGLSNTNAEAVELYHIRFGGHVRPRAPSKLGNKPTKEWYLQKHRDQLAFLAFMIPICRIKRDDLLIAFGFLKSSIEQRELILREWRKDA